MNPKSCTLEDMKQLRIANILRRIARIWSLLSIGFVLLIVIGEIAYPHAPLPTAAEMIGMAFFPIGVAVGLGLGWWREELGGAIATASLIGFYVWCYVDRGRIAGGPYFLLVAAPGTLFLVAWAVRRRTGDRGGDVASAT